MDKTYDEKINKLPMYDLVLGIMSGVEPKKMYDPTLSGVKINLTVSKKLQAVLASFIAEWAKPNKYPEALDELVTKLFLHGLRHTIKVVALDLEKEFVGLMKKESETDKEGKTNE